MMEHAADPKTLKRTRGGRERLLTAAADLFGRHSLAGTSLQMIADRLGISKPAIYHHFRSRDDIVTTLMVPVLTDARQGIHDIALADASDRAEAARAFYTRFVVTHRRVINLVFFDQAALPDDLGVTVDALVDDLARMMAASPDPDDVSIATAVVYGAAALTTRNLAVTDAELSRTVDAVLAVTAVPNVATAKS